MAEKAALATGPYLLSSSSPRPSPLPRLDVEGGEEGNRAGGDGVCVGKRIEGVRGAQCSEPGTDFAESRSLAEEEEGAGWEGGDRKGKLLPADPFLSMRNLFHGCLP